MLHGEILKEDKLQRTAVLPKSNSNTYWKYDTDKVILNYNPEVGHIHDAVRMTDDEVRMYLHKMEVLRTRAQRYRELKKKK